MAGYPWLIFRLQGENFAVNSENISAINKLDRQMVSEIPNSPPDICGVVNFRGNVIPLMDLRLFYNIEPGLQEMMIVIDHSGQQFGILVDEVLAVEDVKWDDAEQDDLRGMFTENCIQAIAKRRQNDELIMLLDDRQIGGHISKIAN